MSPRVVLVVIALVIGSDQMKIKDLQKYIQDNYASIEHKRQANVLKTTTTKELLMKHDDEFNSVIKSKADEETALFLKIKELTATLNHSDRNAHGEKVAALITKERECDAEIKSKQAALDKLQKENHQLSRSLVTASETLEKLKQQYNKRMEVCMLQKNEIEILRNNVDEYVQRTQHVDQQLVKLSTDLQQPTSQFIGNSPDLYASPSARIMKQLEVFDSLLCDRLQLQGGSPATFYSAANTKPFNAYSPNPKESRKYSPKFEQ